MLYSKLVVFSSFFLFAVVLGCSTSPVFLTPKQGSNILFKKDNQRTTVDELLRASGPNVIPVEVSTGVVLNDKTKRPRGCGFVNMPCISVTLCSPQKTNQCQTIPNILVDTGSTGLRIYSDAVTLPLPANRDKMTHKAVGICTTFGFQHDNKTSIWGKMVTADVILGSEPVVKIPIELIDIQFAGQYRADGSNMVKKPACGHLVSKRLINTRNARYNGILGVGPALYDLMDYYGCSQDVCQEISRRIDHPLTNPVGALPVDNNGVVLVLPPMAEVNRGVGGKLILGVDNRHFIFVPMYTQCDWCPGTIGGKIDGTAANILLDSGTNFIGYVGEKIEGKVNGGKVRHAILFKRKGNNPESASLTFKNDDLNFDRKPAIHFSVLEAGTDPTNMLVLGMPWFYGKAIGVVFNGRTSRYGSGPANIFAEGGQHVQKF